MRKKRAPASAAGALDQKRMPVNLTGGIQLISPGLKPVNGRGFAQILRTFPGDFRDALFEGRLCQELRLLQLGLGQIDLHAVRIAVGDGLRGDGIFGIHRGFRDD